MPTLTSTDGTTIGYERSGSGPALILVDGGMCYRAAGPMRPLAALLSEAFTVYTYDRRGRGESTDTLPYAPAREVEDLRALVAAAGGEAGVYGISSGAALALTTAAEEPGITKVAMYEPPYTGEFEDGTRIKEYATELRELLDAGRRGDAVARFMSHVGMPPEAIAGFRGSPAFAVLKAIAPTLAYDDEILTEGRVPRAVAARVTVPVVVIGGGASPETLRAAAKAAADLIPTAEHRVLDGQTHDVAPDALAPVLIDFFSPDRRG
jgi:pimeloyl-ACP methyl ester carboxylesterase